MLKTDLIKAISSKTKIEEDTVRLVMNTMIDTIQENLFLGINVVIHGFITFSLKISPMREMYNVNTQQTKTVGRKYRVKTTLPRQFTEKIAKKTVY